MKKILYFAMAAVVLALAACNPKEENKPDDPQNETIVPQKITVADAFQEYFMSESESATIQYTLSPSNVNVSYTIAWASSDEKVAKVDQKGKVTAVATGSAEITLSIPEYPEVKPAVAKITVLAPAKVGDYIYSDGSWGEDANPSGKSVIAVIYWTGNASLYDPILEQDYPNCTHGLAMSLKQGAAGQWMKDFEYYFFNTDDLSDTKNTFMHMGNSPYCDNAGSLTEWGMVHSSYADKVRPYFENPDLYAGSFPGVGGYTYTAILEEYTRTYPNAGKYPFEFYINAMNLVKDIEAPLTTSRWYVPSIFEAALMVNTALTKPGDFNNTRLDDDKNPLIHHNNENIKIMNAALSKVSGADLLPDDKVSAIASATDTYLPFDSIIDSDITCTDFFEAVYVTRNPNGSDVTADERDNINAEWDSWLKQEAGENYEAYKAEAGDDADKRLEIFLRIKGYENVTVQDVRGSQVILGFSLLPELIYANVSVKDGMFMPVFSRSESLEELKYYSGRKGYDNEKNVVRAIIAF